MTRMSALADCLKTMSNAEKRGKRQVLLRPSSKVVVKFLQVMQKNGEASKNLLRVIKVDDAKVEENSTVVHDC